jgi:hypothetical protein
MPIPAVVLFTVGVIVTPVIGSNPSRDIDFDCHGWTMYSFCPEIEAAVNVTLTGVTLALL